MIGGSPWPVRAGNRSEAVVKMDVAWSEICTYPGRTHTQREKLAARVITYDKLQLATDCLELQNIMKTSV